jgi:hypothetical protein
LEAQPVNYDAASDDRAASDRTRPEAAPRLIDVSAELVIPRFSPLGSLIVVTVLSLALWVGIWAVLSSLLLG